MYKFKKEFNDILGSKIDDQSRRMNSPTTNLCFLYVLSFSDQIGYGDVHEDELLKCRIWVQSLVKSNYHISTFELFEMAIKRIWTKMKKNNNTKTE